MDDLSEHLLDFDPDPNYYNNNFDGNHVFSVFDGVEDFLKSNPVSIDSQNFITVFNQNIRSINQNLDNFLTLFSENTMPDVFVLSETWHDVDTPVVIPGYNSFHTVRQGRSGGVSVFVKGQFSSCLVDEYSYANNNVEICIVKVANSCQHLYICGVYRPHSGSIENFSLEIETVLNCNLLSNSPCIISGDFNINLLREGGDVDGFVDMMRSHHFLQVILDATRPGHGLSASSLIDHIWINQVDNYNCGLLRTGITDHYTTYIQLPFLSAKSHTSKIKLVFRDCSENNQQIFENNIRNFDWQTVKSNNVNDYAQNFINSLNKLYQNSFPLKTKMVTQKYFKNPWLTKEIKKLTDARSSYHKLLLLGLVSPENYSVYRNRVTSILRKCKESYYQNCFRRNSDNIKGTWKLIRKICNGHNDKSISKINFNNTIHI